MSYLNAGATPITQPLDGNQAFEMWGNGSAIATLSYAAPQNDGTVITRSFGPDPFRFSTADGEIGGATVTLTCSLGSVGYSYDGAEPATATYNDISGAPGNGTANTLRGRCAVAAGASAVTISNALVSPTSMVTPVLETADGTLTRVTVTPAAGSFTVTGNATATGNVTLSFSVIA